MKDINKIKEYLDQFKEEVKEAGDKTDFIISWFAKKYNKTIFRPGNLNYIGCRVWTHATTGDKYLCFWDPMINRYTTAINPVITYKRKVN